MNFSDVVKQNTDEKYAKLASGKAERSTTSLKITSCDEYEKKREAFQSRLIKEEAALQDALKSAQSAKKAEDVAAEERRRKEEAERAEAERRRKEEEKREAERKEAERRAAEKAEAERRRKEEEARQAEEKKRKEEEARRQHELVLAEQKRKAEEARRQHEIEMAELAARQAEAEAKRREEMRLEAERRAAEEKRRAEELARQEAENKIKRKKKKIRNSIIAGVVLVAVILGVILFISGQNAKYSADNVSVTVIEKNGESGSSKNLYFTLVFEAENTGSVDILQMVGNFKIYNSKGDCLLDDTLTLNGTLKPDKTLQYDVDLSLSNTDKNMELFEADLSGLKITYQITAIEFEGYKVKEYNNSEVMVLCDVEGAYVEGENEREKSYQNAVSLFNQGKYGEALTLFKALGAYKDSSDYYVQSVYNNSSVLVAQEKYGEAYQSLKEINGYEGVGEKMSDIVEAVLVKAEGLAATGNYLGACNLIEQVDFDEETLLHQAYTYASQGNFAEAVEYGLTVVFIPEGVETIPNNYFKDRRQLKKVILPSTVKSIGYSAFSGCYGLEEINLPNGLTTIGNYAFYKCSSLKTIELPNTVVSLGSNVFEECTRLETVSTSTGLEKIPSYTFKNCTSLTTVTIKNGVEVIESSAFTGCSSLMNVTLPESLQEIQGSAFSKCTSLVEITIPAQVNIITYHAFADCSSLQRVYFANQEGWEYNYGTKLDVSDAQKNAKALRVVGSSTWERK